MKNQKRAQHGRKVSWTKHGTHRLLQVQVLNDDLRTTSGARYPGMKRPEPALAAVA
jgi:hypothetical protein